MSPLDLHVLGTPPAFVLSQNQTLMFNLFRSRFCPKTFSSASSASQQPPLPARSPNQVRFTQNSLTVVLSFSAFLYRFQGSCPQKRACIDYHASRNLSTGFERFFLLFFSRSKKHFTKNQKSALHLTSFRLRERFAIYVCLRYPVFYNQAAIIFLPSAQRFQRLWQRIQCRPYCLRIQVSSQQPRNNPVANGRIRCCQKTSAHTLERSSHKTTNTQHRCI